MAPQPLSSFSRNDDGNDNDSTLQYKRVLNKCISQLCDMAKIELEEGDDLTSQNFVESVIEHVREFFERYYRLIDDHAQRPPFQRGGHVAPPFQLVSHSRGGRHHNNSESSLQIPGQSESSECLEDSTQIDSDTIPMFPAMSIVSVLVSPPQPPEVISVSSTPQYGASPYSSASPFCVISAINQVPTPERTETNIPQNNHHGYHDNVMAALALSPQLLPRDGPQSTLVSLEEKGQPQTTNAAQVGTSVVGVEDNLFNELVQPVHPSSSRQSCPRRGMERNSTKKKVPTQQDRKKTRKKAKQRQSNREIHESKDFENGYYHCTCGSKFKLKTSQKRHLQRYNSERKFTCDHCPAIFLYLSKLKSHLNKQHKIEKPLNEYVTGCTLCGIKFRTMKAFFSHQKTKHNINLWPRWSRKSPRRPPMTPRQLGTTPRQREPDSSPQNPMLMTPRDVEMDFVEQETPHYGNKHGFASEVEEAQVESPQSSGQDLNRQNERHDYGESYGCEICPKAFRDLQQLRTHQREEHQSSLQLVRCNLCDNIGRKIIFESSKSFHSC